MRRRASKGSRRRIQLVYARKIRKGRVFEWRGGGKGTAITGLGLLTSRIRGTQTRIGTQMARTLLRFADARIGEEIAQASPEKRMM